MNLRNPKSMLIISICILCAVSFVSILSAQHAQTSAGGIPPMAFETPEKAAEALIPAAEKFDTTALEQIFGSAGKDLVITDEPARDKEIAQTFSELAHEKKSISIDPKNPNHAILLIGNEDWPFAVPLVKKAGKWYFDSAAGRSEVLYRRIGSNELDAIQICEGFVEAENEYALEKHDNSYVNQYAQRIISTPGKQDGLAWQNADGSWEGPLGENAAKAIEKGYTEAQPYHGYFFKVLKGQGPNAPLGQMDFMVKGAMIGGFALVAAPSEYRVSGVKTFIVSHDAIVYEKDLGANTPDEFKKMEVFNPDKTWTEVPEEDE